MAVWILLIVAGVAIGVVGLLITINQLEENPELIVKYAEQIKGYGLAWIFPFTIISGTVVPLGTPLVVAGASALGMPKLPLVIIASAGFVIGCSINYALVFLLGEPFVKKRYSEQYEDILRWWGRWGMAVFIAFSFIPSLPVDLFALACGLFKMRPLYFATIAFAGCMVKFGIWSFVGGIIGQTIGLI